jgi:hypothetical protein
MRAFSDCLAAWCACTFGLPLPFCFWFFPGGRRDGPATAAMAHEEEEKV